ncbi:MAG: Unknown protein [uncultured Sulfurovum sp.]|uniref:Uncharacterized protein n=1 Tax=uncultured Sulfurovum sp. TaxID=269237 RepID=A0A6S6SW11_9BACT|nr:MAG: Unknown protein [uncultured Sulfurovum sp.]
MLEKFKNISLITKLLYLFAIILFVAWVIPKMSSYYSNVNKYQQSTQELQNISSKHNIANNTQDFSEILFKKDTELLFSKVEINSLGEKKYIVDITMRKEDLKKFHTFVETISLKYYVQVNNDLEFVTNDEIVNVKMNLEVL